MLDYAAAFAATLAAAVIGAVNIAAAITLSGGAPQFKKLPDMLQFGRWWRWPTPASRCWRSRSCGSAPAPSGCW